jgi:hypothetical protein
MSALTLLAVVLEFSTCRAPDLQGAPLKLVYTALGFGAAMGLANLLYSLCPRMEARFQPAQVAPFRRWAFGLGLGFSAALPFVATIAFLGRCR